MSRNFLRNGLSKHVKTNQIQTSGEYVCLRQSWCLREMEKIWENTLIFTKSGEGKSQLTSAEPSWPCDLCITKNSDSNRFSCSYSVSSTTKTLVNGPLWVSSGLESVHCWDSFHLPISGMAADLSLPECPFTGSIINTMARTWRSGDSALEMSFPNLVRSGFSSTEAIICFQVSEWD